ncbi:hypothetical protein [Comamonas sediminis]|uniref:Uncharacterized protein n=1 Tax=Comamonas sediminis TaxID=1783360 RepID=A0ABV4B1W6_9BURK
MKYANYLKSFKKRQFQILVHSAKEGQVNQAFHNQAKLDGRV